MSSTDELKAAIQKLKAELKVVEVEVLQWKEKFNAEDGKMMLLLKISRNVIWHNKRLLKTK